MGLNPLDIGVGAVTEMTLHRDAAALIRQLQAELQDAWHAGLDAGREET